MVAADCRRNMYVGFNTNEYYEISYNLSKSNGVERMNPLCRPENTIVGCVNAFMGKISQDPNFFEEFGWLLCDGRVLDAKDYPELFSALGHLYGGSDDRFHLPDLRGKVLRGIGGVNVSKESRNKTNSEAIDSDASTEDFPVNYIIKIRY